MSSGNRRVTRAASSIGRVGPISPSEIPSAPAPRRASRRAGNGALPAVAAGRSTAYGDNTIAAPAAQGGPLVQDDVANILANLVNPPAPNPRPARDPATGVPPSAAASLSRSAAARALANASAASTPNRNPLRNIVANAPRNNFSDESNLFADANVASSLVSSNGPPPLVPDAAQARLDADRANVQGVAAQNLNNANAQRAASLPAWPIRGLNSFSRSIRDPSCWLSLLWALLCLLALWVIICLLCSISPISLGNISNSGNQDYQENHSHHYGSVFDKINQRLTWLEHNVTDIKSLIVLKPHTLDKLNENLPEQIIFKKDAAGNVIFTEDFWQALNGATGTDEDSDDEEDPKYKVRRMNFYDKHTKWTIRNRNKLDAYTLGHFQKVFPKLLEDNHIFSKEEVIDSIKRTWNEQKESISKDMDILKSELTIAKDDIKKSQSKQGLSQKDVTIAVNEAMERLISTGQIDALVKAQLNRPSTGARQVNHLASATGAIVHMRHTTPTWVYPEQDVYAPTRFIRSLRHNSVPIPNGPMMALMPWNEYGDSWCAPSAENGGLPTSISIIMANEVYPESIIVEHLLAGSLIPGSAPKDMELLAWIEDPVKLEQLQAMSLSMFPDAETESIPKGHVRIGEWKFDARSSLESQKFDIDLDMKSVGLATKRVMIRAKSNWSGGEVPFVCFYRLGLNGKLLHPAPELVVDE